jgi:hypothetical protein
MKKLASVSLLAVTLLLVASEPSHAWGRGWHGGARTHVFVGVGPSFWWGPPYPYYWAYYPPPYYVYSPPPVVVQQPPVYVEQPSAPPPAPPPPPAQSYWYYCPNAKAYYPNVQNCSEAWIKVPPRTE